MRGELECVDWLEDEESVDAPNEKVDDLWNIPLGLKRGELRLPAWRNCLRKYRQKLRMVDDWNELLEIWHLLKDVLPHYWKTKVEDEEKKRFKKRLTVKIMYGPQYHGRLQKYFRRNIGELERMISMRQSLYVEVFGEPAGQRLFRLHNEVWMKNEHLLSLREIPARMSLESIVQYISVELKLNKNNEAGLKDQYDRIDDYNYRGHDDRQRQYRQHGEIDGDGALMNEDTKDIDMDVTNNEQTEYHFFAFVAENTKTFGQQSFEVGKDTTTCRQTAAEYGPSTAAPKRVHEEVPGTWEVLWEG